MISENLWDLSSWLAAIITANILEYLSTGLKSFIL